MTFIMALGMARGAKPDSAEAVFTKSNSMPFYVWDLAANAVR